MKPILSFLLLIFLSHTMSAVEKAFPQTDVGKAEIKKLPAAHLIASQSDRQYFSDDNGLFRPLFRYISSRDIAMTTPVETEIDPGVMYFYIGEDAVDKAQSGTDKVTVHQVPERTVASIGARGGYGEKNFREAETKLRAWLAKQPNYAITGNARGIYWNGPFMPGMFKRFEVHIPVAIIEE
ncbi:MAG: heme-binding protein [Opitutaceae bacterium]